MSSSPLSPHCRVPKEMLSCCAGDWLKWQRTTQLPLALPVYARAEGCGICQGGGLQYMPGLRAAARMWGKGKWGRPRIIGIAFS